MPRMGTPSSMKAGSTWGASLSYTENGPPERMIPLGVQLISDSFVVQLHNKLINKCS